ncbi:MAG: mannonate dehydratase [Alphaproteobacteria bacterium]
MDRRRFLTQARATPKLGTQEPSSEENFRRFQRYGVTHICGWYRIADKARLYPTLDELNVLTDMAARHQLVVEMTDTAVGRGAHSALMLGGDGRMREIEAFQETIRACARAGIPSLKYYLSVLPILRLDKVAGRAGTQYWRWNYAMAATPDGEARMTAGEREDLDFIRRNYAEFNAELYWERVNYVLERIVPVANEYKVRIAQHPHDPGMPPPGLAGIPTILGTVEGLKRFVAMHESPYHGLNFCQGTICENLDDPKTQLFDVIRWFGSRRKIFNVHFRNIRGHRGDFVAETFPDDGEIDMTAAMRTYREVGYDGMLMPDHIPDLPGGTAQEKSEMFSFGYGHIRALIQATA